jgi:hypothetical protein
MSADQPTPSPVSAEGPTEVLAPGPMRELRAQAAVMGSSPPPSGGGGTSPPRPNPSDRPDHRRRPRRRRRALVVVALLAVAGLAAGGLGLGTVAGDLESTSGRVTGVVQDPNAAAEDEAEGVELDIEIDGEGLPPGFALGDQAGEGVDELDGIEVVEEWPSTGGAGAGSTDPIPPQQPQPQPQPEPQPDGADVGEPPAPEPDDESPPDPEPAADPCAGLQPGAHLVTTPDPLHLAPGLMSSTLTIRNCGTDPVNWTAATKPSVSLDDVGGALAGGAEHALGFTIDPSKFADAAIAFKIKVSEPGFNQYVDITAVEAGLADAGSAPPDPGGTITTGGPTGCAASCITKAWLTPNASTPNLALDVETSTPARVSVYVSTSAPVAGPDGQPSFPDGGLIAATNDLNVVWSAALSPLAAATDYHIIVRATDADGGASNRVGTFRTVTPAVDPGLGEAAPGGDSGCSTQCITKAWLTPDPSSFDMDLEVTSHTLARFEAYVSTDAPGEDPDGHPSFPGATPMTTNFAYEKAWTTTLGPLEPATTYHVIVKATDGMFRSSYQVGSFETRVGANRLLVTFHEIRVHHDGDKGANRGELSFVFAIDGAYVRKAGEFKVGSGTTLNLSDGDRWPGIGTVVDLDPSPLAWLPMLGVAGYERDADGVNDFCSLGEVQSDPGSDEGCDVKWDVASSGLIQTGGLDSLPSCPDLGVDAEEVASAHCLELESVGNGDDYPRFTVIASVQPITT